MLFSVRLSEKRRHIVSRFKGWHHRTATGVVACLDRIRCTEMEAPASAVPWVHWTERRAQWNPTQDPDGPMKSQRLIGYRNETH
mmetsp:Transcript_44652/g.91126  ORF Transcript_44652/g.91126 Transcript_44652/m.91126 type:complete len:84 (+) Transcript_44652:90-341(+)